MTPHDARRILVEVNAALGLLSEPSQEEGTQAHRDWIYIRSHLLNAKSRLTTIANK